MASTSPNVLLILSDQDRHFDSFPPGYSLPGRERLQWRGTTFTNHQITSCVCTPARSTVYTGQHIQRTTVFDNVNFPWSNDLPLDQPTIGHRLRDVGYYSAYMGKWHLSEVMEEGRDPMTGADPEFRDLLDDYGFSDFISPGDGIGGTRGGYLNDQMITAGTKRWLRFRGLELAAEKKPWFLAVNLVNPHDIMYFNTDRPGESSQVGAGTAFPLMGAPDTPLYRRTWDIDLPASRHEAWDSPGRPAAHREYQEARRFLTGMIPDEDHRWKSFLDYYLNCISDMDRQVDAILQELDDQGFSDNTVVIYSADHGELGGAHGMSGKGATTYREQVNVPLIISHPDVGGGGTSDAVTSHLDLVPTILGFADADADVSELPGKNVGDALGKGASAADDVRDGALFAFNMFTFIDSGFIGEMMAARGSHDEPEEPPQIDFSKRGAIRSVFDGRYRFSRYFANTQHHRPETLDDLLSLNDLELFDLEADPDEVRNLATDPTAAEDLILQMNQLMNQLIDEEVGVDDGGFLPVGDQQPWEVERWDV